MKLTCTHVSIYTPNEGRRRMKVKENEGEGE
jgi:hypothetical protein